ncbi:MAG: hypothetical protein PHT44_01535 [Candidatus Portnoybacteria bacterium]|nr:hypothetical protein [Candidatus Portnoybacteria bacterium]MDD4982723.1 hypothetical protein [Candidatus Portnoybacteria bacterium]
MKKTGSLHKILFLAGVIVLMGFAALPAKPTLSANSDFILTWSTSSYVPQTYEGKALPVRGSAITVFALPVKKLAQNPDYLYYRWLLDDDVVGWAGGMGKSSFKFSAEKWAGDFHKVESQILDSQQRAVLSQDFIYIKIVNPEILISGPDNSNYSLIEKISAGTGKNIKLTAQPFFFNIGKLSDLNFSWQLNDQELPSQGDNDQNILSLTTPKGILSEAIYKNIRLTVSSKNNDMEWGSINLSLEIR